MLKKEDGALNKNEIRQIYQCQGGEVVSISPLQKIWN